MAGWSGSMRLPALVDLGVVLRAGRPAAREQLVPGERAVGRGGRRSITTRLADRSRSASASLQRATWSAVSRTTTRGLGVLGDVGDLAGGEGVVDRHRRRAGVHRADVGEHVLDPVGGHDRDPVAGLHAQLDEARPRGRGPARAARARTACASPAPSMPILSEYAGLSPCSATVSANACAMLRPLIEALDLLRVRRVRRSSCSLLSWVGSLAARHRRGDQ